MSSKSSASRVETAAAALIISTSCLQHIHHHVGLLQGAALTFVIESTDRIWSQLQSTTLEPLRARASCTPRWRSEQNSVFKATNSRVPHTSGLVSGPQHRLHKDQVAPESELVSQQSNSANYPGRTEKQSTHMVLARLRQG